MNMNIMKSILAFALLAIAIPIYGQYTERIDHIMASDPFVLANAADSTYYMYSTGGGGKVMARTSKNLEYWSKPFVGMSFPESHWAGSKAPNWASEVHKYKGKYYLFTTSNNHE